MRFKTIEELEEHLEAHEELLAAAIPLLDYMATLDGRRTSWGFDRDEVSVDGSTISASWDNYRCGESDIRTVSIQAEDLFNPDFKTMLKERHAAWLEEEKRIQRKIEEDRKRAATESRRKQWEKLKEEFGE